MSTELNWRERRREAGSPSMAEERVRGALSNAKIPVRYMGAELAKDFTTISVTFKPDQSYYVSGSVGTGKTHLICSMLKERILSRHAPKECLFMTADEIFDEIRESYSQDRSGGSFDRILTRLKEIDILAIDDLGAEKITDWTIGKFYQIINARYNNLKVTYISSNLAIKDISANLNERIGSRITQMCEVVLLGGKSRRKAKA